MVERYTLTQPASVIAERFHAEVPEFYKPRFNAAPSQLLPVVTHIDRQGLSLFYWGKPPEWAKNKTLSERIINLKAETLADRPSVLRMLGRSRCIVPADGFYLWKTVGSRTRIPYRFRLPKNEPFAIAGSWEEFENAEGEMTHTFVLITMPSVAEVEKIDGRMPVILDRQAETQWMHPDASPEDLLGVLAHSRAAEFEGYTVSPRIASVADDQPSMITPLPPADQFGNLTLFD